MMALVTAVPTGFCTFMSMNRFAAKPPPWLGGPETTADELQDAWRPSASVTEQLSVVVPTGNNEPDGGVQPTFSGLTPPDTVGANVSGTGLPSVEDAVGRGQVIVGGDGGPVTTTTVLHEAVVLLASTAVQVTGVEPTGNSEPEAGEH